MIAAVIVLIVALLGVSVYAAVLHTRLQNVSQQPAQEQRFREIAAALLNESQEKLSASNSAKLTDLLSPLQKNIEAFNRTIDDKYAREASERGALREKIDELRSLNESLGREARQLSDALRGNSKVQGDWGEMILETLLVQAGFTEGREFQTQMSVRNDAGANIRPDVVVNFPDGGCVVIDSKASLTAYVNFTVAESETARSAALTAHIASVRAHVRELAAKNYQEYVGRERKLDFVMMFIPNEGAYIAAMQGDPGLWQEAYDRQVLIISPTHLFSVLKLIRQMWRHDDQTRNALLIADEAGKLYDKFAGLYKDMEDLGKNIEKVSAGHVAAMRKLNDGPGNLVGKVEKLREMGAKTSKKLEISN
ncbi:MAG: DNA recombination protein RmuC [Bacteroides sp.]|nr:DNA recombination protein RmuC [Bacteroides sp.]MCM1378921.1 DNA recombination protein RmuC [Bacteroides sp.]MCM1445537.1 DNA recombination protein RmuC [Prevotella sp.]